MDGTTESGARLEPALSNEYYTSAEIYRREHPRIFYRSWLFLAHDSDLANLLLHLVVNIEKAKPAERRGRKATGPRFLREAMEDLPKDPRPPSCSPADSSGHMRQLPRQTADHVGPNRQSHA